MIFIVFQFPDIISIYQIFLFQLFPKTDLSHSAHTTAGIATYTSWWLFEFLRHVILPCLRKKLAKDPKNTSNTDSSPSYQTRMMRFIILSSSLFIFNHDHWPSSTQWQSQVLDFWHLQGGRHAADLSFDQGEGCGRVWWIHLNLCFYVLVAFQAKSCWPF